MSLVSLESVHNRDKVEADVCIIGAGPAGISLALAMDTAGIRSVLLESGGLGPEPATQSLQETLSTGIPYSGAETRLRHFGGSSNCWAGWCRPLDPVDFKERIHIPDSGWPISYADYAQHLPAAHALCELGEVDYSLKHWRPKLASPWDSHHDLHSDGLRSGVWQHSPPTRFGKKYRQRLEQSTNCTVVLHANATSAHLSDRYVSWIEARNLDGKTLHVKARFFVLACGGIENARLLLTLNGSGKHAPGNEHGMVGRHFTDHLIFHNLLDLYPLTPQLRLYVDQIPTRSRTLHAVTPWLGLAENVQKQHRLSNTTLRLQRAIPIPTSHTTQHSVWHALSEMAGHTDRSVSIPERMSSVMISEIHPNPSSRITLSDKRDSMGIPRARIDWRIRQADLDSIRRSAELVARDTLQHGIARSSAIRLRDIRQLDSYADYWIGYHHYGTTRMAADPRKGVVNEDCRVHALSNLYVAGSSVFPTTGASTPTLSIVALTLRLGEHLRQRLSA